MRNWKCCCETVLQKCSPEQLEAHTNILREYMTQPLKALTLRKAKPCASCAISTITGGSAASTAQNCQKLFQSMLRESIEAKRCNWKWQLGFEPAAATCATRDELSAENHAGPVKITDSLIGHMLIVKEQKSRTAWRNECAS